MTTARTAILVSAKWALATLVAACGTGAIGGSAGPCEGADPAPECATICANDDACSAGFYCGSAGTCTADCTAGGGECGAGFRCDDRGRCVADGDGGGGGDGGCPAIAVHLQPVIPTVVLLIDQSGSMDQSFGSSTRWDAVRTALVDATIGVVTQLADRVIFGATLYSSINGNAGGTCPLLQTAAPALDNYGAINTLLQTNAPQSDTPTAESITAVTASFPAIDPEKPTPRVLVLATDGNPDNCVDPDAHDLGSQMMSENAVLATYAQGIQTYVLSVGDDVAQPHLQRMANAGVGEPIDTGLAPYYVANNPAELVAAFDVIINGARTCTFLIDEAVSLGDAQNGTVQLNGMTLEYGTDWHMLDEHTLELLGAACQTFLDEPNVLLTAEFPCGAIIL
jgi:hypothetical protein